MSDIPTAAAAIATTVPPAADSGTDLAPDSLPLIAPLSLASSEQSTESTTTVPTAKDPTTASAPPAGSPKTKTKTKTKKRKVKNAPQFPNNPNVLITPCDPWPRPYFFEDGLRKVAPYFYTYNTFCKERWRGRKLVEIYTSEFRDRPPEYYVRAIANGTVMVNGAAVGLDYVMRNNDLVTHTLHRHEPAVSGEPVRVLHEDDGMLVIVKPAGIPVHPAGRYGYNSVLEILKDERGPGFIPHPCHRLDRLTSGIMFIAKNPEAAEKLRAQIAGRTVRKEYVARVIGEFPDGEIVCDQPILQISPKLGLNRVRANGKSARTVFQRLAYYPPRESTKNPAPTPQEDTAAVTAPNSEEQAPVQGKPWLGKKGYSIVRCLPVTGRTHQIRVHLQYLGHPIQNDPIYANQKVWGFNLGSGDADGTEHADEDVISRLERMGKEEAADAVAYHDEMVDEYYKRRAELMTGKTCETCNAPLYTDPGDQELSLWLHSLRYQDADGAWGYVTPLPKWAMPPEGVEGPTEVGGLDALINAAKAAGPIDV